MTYEVKYCFEDEGIGHVVENMTELRERCLPVINRDKTPCRYRLDRRSGQRGLIGENGKRVTEDFATGWATAQSKSDGLTSRLAASLADRVEGSFPPTQLAGLRESSGIPHCAELAKLQYPGC
jgi:hypothetical protein